MTPLIQHLAQFKSMYEAGKHYDIHPQQLARWVKADALIDDSGQVWSMAKGGKLTSPTTTHNKP